MCDLVLCPQEKERNKGQKKSLSEQQRSEEAGPLGPAEPTEEEEDRVIKVSRQANDSESRAWVPQPQNVLGYSVIQTFRQHTPSQEGETDTNNETINHVRHQVRGMMRVAGWDLEALL